MGVTLLKRVGQRQKIAENSIKDAKISAFLGKRNLKRKRSFKTQNTEVKLIASQSKLQKKQDKFPSRFQVDGSGVEDFSTDFFISMKEDTKDSNQKAVRVSDGHCSNGEWSGTRCIPKDYSDFECKMNFEIDVEFEKKLSKNGKDSIDFKSKEVKKNGHSSKTKKCSTKIYSPFNFFKESNQTKITASKSQKFFGKHENPSIPVKNVAGFSLESPRFIQLNSFTSRRPVENVSENDIENPKHIQTRSFISKNSDEFNPSPKSGIWRILKEKVLKQVKFDGLNPPPEFMAAVSKPHLKNSSPCLKTSIPRENGLIEHTSNRASSYSNSQLAREYSCEIELNSESEKSLSFEFTAIAREKRDRYFSESTRNLGSKSISNLNIKEIEDLTPRTIFASHSELLDFAKKVEKKSNESKLKSLKWAKAKLSFFSRKVVPESLAWIKRFHFSGFNKRNSNVLEPSIQFSIDAGRRSIGKSENAIKDNNQGQDKLSSSKSEAFFSHEFFNPRGRVKENTRHAKCRSADWGEAVFEVSRPSHSGVSKKVFGKNSVVLSILSKPFSNIIEEYEFEDCELGRGRYGIIRACIHKSTRRRYACKTISKQFLRNSVDAGKIRNEIKIMECVKHLPGMASLVECFEDEQNVHVVMEICEGGELFDRIKLLGTFEEKEAAMVCQTILQVLSRIHALGIMHRDIKLENILLMKYGCNVSLQVVDFGSATFFEPGVPLTEVVGTPCYLAPDVLRKKYGPPADVWSAGVVVYILLCGVPPFWSDYELLKMENSQLNFETLTWKKISPEAKDLVQKMLTFNPPDRITADEALGHPWFQIN